MLEKTFQILKPIHKPVAVTMKPRFQVPHLRLLNTSNDGDSTTGQTVPMCDKPF